MTINSITGKTANPLPVKTAPKTDVDVTKETTVSNAERTDSIAITAIAKEIHKALESSSASSAVDLERVTAVKKALADGSYSINAERIAKKLIQFEKLLPQDNSS